jgi:hypothetical protein
MSVLKKLCGESLDDSTFLAVATPQSTTPYLEKTVEEWEEICSSYGFEYIDSEAKGRNRYFGEYGSFEAWCEF